MQSVFRQLVLIARVVIGGIFVAHGWQKLTAGLSHTAAQFAQMGMPAPTVAAYYATFIELAAGLALVIGLLLPIAGVLLAIDMLGAFLFINAKHGVFIQQGGFELVAALGIAALLIGFSGGGTVAVDQLLMRRRGRRY